MTKERDPRRRRLANLTRVVLAVVFVGFSVAFWWDALLEVGPHQVRGGDQSQWLRMAVNLNRHHTFSKDMVPKGGGVRPTAYREPVYPAFVAAQMALNPSLRDLDAQQVYNEGEGHPALVALQVPQILLMYATILLTMGIVWKLSRSAVFALGAGIVIALSTTLQREMLIYRSETLAVFLTTALAFVLVVAAERRSPAAYAGAGALAGLLALTKAVFGYFWLPFVLVFALVAWRAGWKRRPAVISGAAFVLAFGVVVALAFAFRDSLPTVSWGEPLRAMFHEMTQDPSSVSPARTDGKTPLPNSPSDASWEESLHAMLRDMTADPSSASPARTSSEKPVPGSPPREVGSPLQKLPDLPTVAIPARPEPALPPPNSQDAQYAEAPSTNSQERIMSDLLSVMQELSRVGTDVTKNHDQRTR